MFKTATTIQTPASLYAHNVRFGYAEFPPLRVPFPIAFSKTRTRWRKAQYALFVEYRITRAGNHYLLYKIARLDVLSGNYDLSDAVFSSRNPADIDSIWQDFR